jgi:hypothetical protein
MSSFRSYFGKKHKYETLAALLSAAPTPEAIIRTDPKDISSHILTTRTPNDENDKNYVDKMAALNRLLSIKKTEKELGVNLEARKRAIDKFLTPNPEVDALMAQAIGEIVEETKKESQQNIELNELKNRARALRDLAPIHDEGDIQEWRRLRDLGKGGKRTRKHKKNGSRKHNKKSSRKNKKRTTKNKKRTTKNKKRKY